MPYFRGKYITDNEASQVMERLDSEEREKSRSELRSSSSSSDLLLSAAVGFATGSSLLGGLIGGSLLGGMLGDLAEGTDDSIL